MIDGYVFEHTRLLLFRKFHYISIWNFFIESVNVVYSMLSGMSLKYIFFLISIVIICVNSSYGDTTHFQYTKTLNSASVAVRTDINPNIDGVPLSPGDEIGVFTPDSLCVGARVWNGETNIAIAVWENSVFTSEVDGIRNGEKMSFRVWQKATDTEIKVVEVTYREGDHIYATDQLYILSSLTAFNVPQRPELILPNANERQVSIPVEFKWSNESTALRYNFEVSTDIMFRTIVVSDTGSVDTIRLVHDLEYESTYFWRVQSTNRGGRSGWTTPRRFVTEAFIDTVIVPSDTLTIPLHSSWNMISSNLVPINPSMDRIFENLQAGIVFVKNGNGDVYWPANEIYGIEYWDVRQSFHVYVNEPDTLHIYGSRTDAALEPIVLEQGWNSPAFLSPIPMNVNQAFSSLGDRIELVRSNDGRIYWPAQFTNTIHQLQPGEGYQIYMKEAGVLEFPAIQPEGERDTIRISAENNANQADPSIKYYQPQYINTGESSILSVRVDSSRTGDEIGIWDGADNLVGSGIVQENSAVLVVWGDNQMTREIKDGANPGEQLRLTYFTVQDSMEYDLRVTHMVNLTGDSEYVDSLRYVSDGIFIVNAVRAESDESGGGDDEGDDEDDEIPNTLPVRYLLEQNYPNPFNPTTTIRYSTPVFGHVYLGLYNTLGQRVSVLVDEIKSPGEYEISVNAGELPSGVYVYHLRAGYFIQTRKMLLIR
jgi:hypothetical protein